MLQGFIAAVVCLALATFTLTACGQRHEGPGSGTLPGLTPEKVSPILEKEGFVRQDSPSEFMWVFVKGQHTVRLYVQPGSDELVNIHATSEQYPEPDELKSFLSLVASLPIEGVDQEWIQTWLDVQFDATEAMLEQQLGEHMTVEYVLKQNHGSHSLDIGPAYDESAR